MGETFTPREPDRLTDDALPAALADEAEADTAEEVRPQRVIVTAHPHWHDDTGVLHMMNVTTADTAVTRAEVFHYLWKGRWWQRWSR